MDTKWSWKFLENAREKVLESHGNQVVIVYAPFVHGRLHCEFDVDRHCVV